MIRPIQDTTTDTLRSALRGLELRQQAIAHNVANVETPGFRAQQVSFEDTLRSALRSGEDTSGIEPTVSSSASPTRLNGNNVSLDSEILLQDETKLRVQLIVQAMNAKYALMRSAITGN